MNTIQTIITYRFSNKKTRRRRIVGIAFLKFNKNRFSFKFKERKARRSQRPAKSESSARFPSVCSPSARLPKKARWKGPASERPEQARRGRNRPGERKSTDFQRDERPARPTKRARPLLSRSESERRLAPSRRRPETQPK